MQITTVEQFTLSIFNSAQEDNVFRFEVVHSGEGKNKFLKKLCFILNKGTLSIFLVLKTEFRCGIYWKDNQVF